MLFDQSLTSSRLGLPLNILSGIFLMWFMARLTCIKKFNILVIKCSSIAFIYECLAIAEWTVLKYQQKFGSSSWSNESCVVLCACILVTCISCLLSWNMLPYKHFSWFLHKITFLRLLSPWNNFSGMSVSLFQPRLITSKSLLYLGNVKVHVIGLWFTHGKTELYLCLDFSSEFPRKLRKLPKLIACYYLLQSKLEVSKNRILVQTWTGHLVLFSERCSITSLILILDWS